MAIEEAKYDVLEKDGAFELRQYYPNIVAETFVMGTFEDAGNIGFRRLFAFISGENLKNQSIEMTAPVSQKNDNEKISMTAPVNMQKVSGSYRVTFIMPSNYTIDTLPKPIDKEIQIRQEPGKVIAVYKYSGGWSEKRYEKMKEKLLSIIKSRNLKPLDVPVFARYNSPFMLWLFRRNEILLHVDYSSN